jgi:uncharacterized protein
MTDKKELFKFNEDSAIEDFFEIVPKSVLKKIVDEFYIKQSYIHGTPHWSRVFYYGHYLAELTGMDKENAAFFSIFHDSKRFNDDVDLEHGKRGAEFFRTFDKIITLKPEQKDIIYEACRVHNTLKQSDSLEVGVCLDADRLDLWRVGIIPENEYLHTIQAKSEHMKSFTLAFTENNEIITKLSDKIIRSIYEIEKDTPNNISLLNKIKHKIGGQ